MPELPETEYDDTPPDALGVARGMLITASRLGHAAMAIHDARGGHEIFACAARTVVLGSTAAPAVVQRLQAAVDAADLEPAAADRAAILSRAVTELLGEVIEDEDEAGDRQIERIQHLFATAISLGAPAYNHGLHRSCYEVYAAAARIAARRWPDAKSVHERLKHAQETAAAVVEESRRAWVLREAFDEVLTMNPRTARAAISRREMRLLISMAIQIGAPVYNLGDRRGCYEIYAATARLLTQVAPPEPKVKEFLRDVLQKSVLEPDVTEQAWMLRRAFDSILGYADDGE